MDNKFIYLKKLLEEKKKNFDINDIERINNLDYLLKNENLFFDLDLETSLGIFEFLGVPQSQMIDLYFELIKPENIKKEDNFITISKKK